MHNLLLATSPSVYVAAAYITFGVTMFAYLGILSKRFLKTSRQLAELAEDNDE